MKKLFFILFSIIFALNAVACGTEPTNTTQTTPTTGTSTTATTENGAGEAGDPIMRPAQEIKIVDFNLLAEEETVATRKTEMISTMLSYDADSIGVQEARGSWVSALRVGLGSKYGRVGIADRYYQQPLAVSSVPHILGQRRPQWRRA